MESQREKKLSLDWRRSKVLELNSQGYSQSETAKILQVSLGTVYRDLSIIRQQARKNLQMHIEKTLPDEYNRCLTGLNQVLKTCWYIVNKQNTDDKTKLQATAIINDSYKYVMDLTTNGVVVTNALEYIQGMTDHLNESEKKLSQEGKGEESKESEEPDYGEEEELEEGQEKDTGELEEGEKTTNDVF